MRDDRFVLDTSFILALLNPNDIQHRVAKATLFDLKPDVVEFIIPVVCVVESLIKNPSPTRYIDILRELINKRDFEVNLEKDIEIISGFPLKLRSSLKANDCMVIAISLRLNARLLTLDKRLEKAFYSVGGK